MAAIFFTSSKGGSGKTTNTVNLGEALRRFGKSVVIVCLDGSTMMAVCWRRAYSMKHEGDAPLPDVIHLSGQAVGREIEALKSRHDFVIVDAGAGATRENGLAMAAADLVVVPTSGSSSEFITTMAYCQMIRKVQMDNGGRPAARVLLNRVRMNSKKSLDQIEAYMDPSFPVPPLGKAIPDRAAFEQLAGEGVSVFDYRPASELRNDYLELAREVAGLVGVKLPKVPRGLSQR